MIQVKVAQSRVLVGVMEISSQILNVFWKYKTEFDDDLIMGCERKNIP